MLSAGTRLGSYEIAGPLGAGGMGEGYRARDTRLDRVVALKVLPEDVTHDPERRACFEREARAIAALSHSHICTSAVSTTSTTELYYVSPERNLMAVAVSGRTDFAFEQGRPLMAARTAGWEGGNAMGAQYAATAAGQRFLISTAAEIPLITVMLNWAEALTR
jgi:hypothetical protein